MTRKKNGKIALLTALAIVAVPLGASVVNAQTTGTTGTSAAAQAVDYAQVFINKLAGALGIDAAKLESAIKQASAGTIDEALKNQDITRAQADQMKLNAENGRFGFLGGRGFGGMHGMGRGGFGFLGSQTVLDAAAKALGTTSSDLLTQLRSGKTLSEIAKEKNVTEQKVTDAIAAAAKTELDAAVKAGRLSQAQADQVLADVKANGLNLGARGLGGRGLDGFGGRGGRGGFGPRGFDNPDVVPNSFSQGTTGI